MRNQFWSFDIKTENTIGLGQSFELLIMLQRLIMGDESPNPMVKVETKSGRQLQPSINYHLECLAQLCKGLQQNFSDYRSNLAYPRLFYNGF